MYVLKVWYEVVFGQCPPWILKQCAAQQCDLYLLCTPDLPWVADHLREYPDPAERARHYKMYLDILINDGRPFVIVSGTEEERLQCAIDAIEKRKNADFL
ncbi:MAG: hypothetical protein EOO15_05720 [Chitinophagaceae bacterium]|nr:MAG: hypothetical protein EOO15_05720 [Chitinophagaceae bacterium]